MNSMDCMELGRFQAKSESMNQESLWGSSGCCMNWCGVPRLETIYDSFCKRQRARSKMVAKRTEKIWTKLQ